MTRLMEICSNSMDKPSDNEDSASTLFRVKGDGSIGVQFSFEDTSLAGLLLKLY